MTMFGKNSQKLETIVGDGSEVKGELNGKGTVRIDGVVEGNICADWVIVGESGKIKGNVKTRGMVVAGKVEGNIEADEIVELKPKAHVSGEIRTGRLAVSEGAVFDGQSRMKKNSETEKGSEARILSLKPPSTPS
jgi:cytoskeletal protein CcmA (bactofilin family)